MQNSYNKDSIESLSPLEFTRLRPQVYAGDCTYSTQLLIEIVSNAIDEYKIGHGNHIDITIDNKNKIFSVKDNGQGFLVNSKRDDGLTILEASYSIANTSGKYKDDGTYAGIALGLHGLGCKITNFLSHWLKVRTVRDGAFEEIEFEEGVFKSRKTGKTKEPCGTSVSWHTSEQFFTHSEVDEKACIELFKMYSYLFPGLLITMNGTSYKSERGLQDYIDEETKGKELIKNRCIIDFTSGKESLNWAMTYTTTNSSTIVPYVNGGLTEAGPHLTQIKTLITREFNKFFRDKGWLKEKDDNLSGNDCQEGLFLVFNLTTTGVAYNAQVKSTVTKLEMKPFTPIITRELQKWLSLNEAEVKKIADKALLARKAREAARKASEAVKTGKTKDKGLKAKLAFSDKLKDCSMHDPKNNTLLIVEGLSAGSAAIEARDPKTQAIMMLRGKTLSVLKSTDDKVYSNAVYKDLIAAIGAGIGKTFDVNKMNYNKIVITSDADSDGANIELLLTTFFFTYMRPLVEAGKLYRAVTPLYILRKKGKDPIYCYTQEEYEAIDTKGYEVTRLKGLGECDSKTLHEICFSKENYRRITVSDIEEARKHLQVLMGKEILPRRQFIYDNAKDIGFNFD